MLDPGVGGRKKLPALLADTPGLAVGIDSFEQLTQRPKRRQRAYDSGKKKARALKSQVGVDGESGRVVDVSDSVPGPCADIELLAKSKLPRRRPKGVGGIGDSAYMGIAGLRPDGLGACPRRKPRATTPASAVQNAFSTPSMASVSAAVSREVLQNYKEYLLEPGTIEIDAPQPPPATHVREIVEREGYCRLLVEPTINDGIGGQLRQLGFTAGEYDPLLRRVVWLWENPRIGSSIK